MNRLVYVLKNQYATEQKVAVSSVKTMTDELSCILKSVKCACGSSYVSDTLVPFDQEKVVYDFLKISLLLPQVTYCVLR